MLQNKLQKNAEGKVVILNGGVEQDLNTYLTSLKNPGSGWEHHFKPSTAAGMGAKPSPTSNGSGGQGKSLENGQYNSTNDNIRTEPSACSGAQEEAQKSCSVFGDLNTQVPLSVTRVIGNVHLLKD